MPAYELEVYWLAITKIEAQEIMVGLNLESYPHMKRKAQSDFANKIDRLANPEKFKPRELDWKDLGSLIEGAARGK